MRAPTTDEPRTDVGATLEVDVRLDRAGVETRHAFRTDAPVTGVFGRSGAGKTTLLHLVAGLVAPTSGVIRLGGDVLFDAAAGTRVPPHRRRIGVVFQEDRLFPHLSVRGNLTYGHPREGTAVALDDVVGLLELGPLLHRGVRDLSGGERRRIAIGRAILAAPRLLLLDEPLSFLDLEHKRRILGLVARIRDELRLPMLHVSHDLTEILQLTDRLLVVDGGRTIAHGGLADVMRDTTSWPLVRGLDPTNVLRLTVRGHDRAAGLTRLTGPPREEGDAGATLLGPLADLAADRVVHVAVRPEDIALARAPVSGISIQNQLPGRIVDVTTHADRAVVEIDADLGRTLLVEVSHRTVASMDLGPGVALTCLVKSNAVRYVG
jgi:molybdate transport system ATP-binding protein